MVPDEPVLLARYRVTNTSGQGRSFDLMELADLAGLDGDNASDGTAGGASSGGALAGNMRAFWDGASRAWIVYLGREKPAFLVFGAFDFRGQRAATSATGDGPLGKGSPLLTTCSSRCRTPSHWIPAEPERSRSFTRCRGRAIASVCRNIRGT
jgi:hypothetical protein